MTTKTLSVSPHTRLVTPQRVAAGLVWVAAVWTTLVFLQSLGVAPISWGIIASVIIQTAFTFVESRIWRGDYSLLGVLVLGGDVLINAGGMWVWLARIDQTPSWGMLVETLAAPETLGNYSKLAIAAVVGIILAYLPEAIWRAR